jgi:23S rRNA G2445 N2-methylase RlmL
MKTMAMPVDRVMVKMMMKMRMLRRAKMAVVMAKCLNRLNLIELPQNAELNYLLEGNGMLMVPMRRWKKKRKRKERIMMQMMEMMMRRMRMKRKNELECSKIVQVQMDLRDCRRCCCCFYEAENTWNTK